MPEKGAVLGELSDRVLNSKGPWMAVTNGVENVDLVAEDPNILDMLIGPLWADMVEEAGAAGGSEEGRRRRRRRRRLLGGAVDDVSSPLSAALTRRVRRGVSCGGKAKSGVGNEHFALTCRLCGKDKAACEGGVLHVSDGGGDCVWSAKRKTCSVKTKETKDSKEEGKEASGNDVDDEISGVEGNSDTPQESLVTRLSILRALMAAQAFRPRPEVDSLANAAFRDASFNPATHLPMLVIDARRAALNVQSMVEEEEEEEEKEEEENAGGGGGNKGGRDPTKAPRCEDWCLSDKRPWSVRCGWDSNACSLCTQCPKPKTKDDGDTGKKSVFTQHTRRHRRRHGSGSRGGGGGGGVGLHGSAGVSVNDTVTLALMQSVESLGKLVKSAEAARGRGNLPYVVH